MVFSRRHLRVLTGRSRRRVIFLLGGVMIGAAAVGLAAAADRAQAAFTALLGISEYISLIVTPAGFMLSVFLTKRFFQNSQGSGIPQVIAARMLPDPVARSRLVSLRIAVGKILLTLLGLLCGGSLGREGPTVQIGASIMFAVGRLSPRRQAGLLLAGSAAGIAAAFNTPLAGIVFGIEEMSRSFESRNSSLVIATVIAAGLVALALQGNYTYFGSSAEILHTWQDWLAVPICGVIGGVAGGLFAQITIRFARGFLGRGARVKKHPLLFACFCGLVVATCGILSGSTIYGTGYEQVRSALENHGALSDNFGVLKFIATLASTVSGAPGGIFSPSLAIGAGLGANVAHLLPSTPVASLILMGMVAYLAGVVQAPMTSFVIVGEMTGNHAMIIPLMAASAIAYAVSRLVCDEGIYHALSKGFLVSVTSVSTPATPRR